MSVNLEIFELRNLLADASELGGKKALIGAGLVSPILSAREAHRLYGRSTIERWVKEKLITPQKDGPRNCGVRFDAMALEVISKSSNRLSFFRHLESDLS